MKKIESCTAELVKAIQESSEYQEFCRVRDEVAKDPQKRERINRFRRHIFEVQNTKESVDMYEEMERLGREYEDFRPRRRSMHFCAVSCVSAGSYRRSRLRSHRVLSLIRRM